MRTGEKRNHPTPDKQIGQKKTNIPSAKADMLKCRIQFITDNRHGYSHSEAAEKVLKGGCRWVQLRMKGATDAEIIEEGRRVATLCKAYGATFIIDDKVHLVKRLNADGVHLGKHDMSVREARQILGNDYIIGGTANTMVDVVRLYDEGADYIGCGPYRFTTTKKNLSPTLGLTGYSQIVKEMRERGINLPIVAIGGITEKDIPRLMTTGITGIALSSSVLRDNHPTKSMRGIRTTINHIEQTPPIVLTIAGSDSSGGAGIQADIKAISAIGGYAASVITAITAQNTLGVSAIEPVTPSMVRAQMEAIFNDVYPAAIKTGMLFNKEIVEQIAELIQRYTPNYVVCDPVMVATSGAKLISDEAIETIQKKLFTLCTLITPNLSEASLLAGRKLQTIDDMERAAQEMRQKYNCSVLIKGGHLDKGNMCDLLCHNDQIYRFNGHCIETNNLHGTGCTLSAAIATYLAKGNNLPDAVKMAKDYVTQCIVKAKNMHIGEGHGPLWHFERE